jgi:hypothetical protein
MRSSLTFALVEWFAGIVPPPLVTSVSAGSHMTGSHTAALDSNGTLYTWGKASACGHIGSRQSLSDAASNAFSTIFTTNAGTGQDSNGPIVYPRVVSAFKNRPVIKISCGGGFCVAVACEPKVRMDKNEEGGAVELAMGEAKQRQQAHYPILPGV